MSDNLRTSDTGSMRIPAADPGTQTMHQVGLKPPGSAMVVFDHVSKRYVEGDHVSVGMDDVSLRIDKGEFVFVVGHSGSGKSTFIRLMLKESDPDQGKIMVGGRSLSTLKQSKVPLLRRNIGCVFQDFKLLPNRSVFENIAYAMQVTGASKQEIRRRVPQIIHLVGLSEKVDRFPDELSGGEQQRVSIARAFINRPPLLIADEPTGNLDPETSLGIMDLLLRINREGGTTVIVATHDTGIVDRLRKRVIQLEGGRLVRDQARGGYDDTAAQEIGLDRTSVTSQFPAVSEHVPGTTGVFPAITPQQLEDPTDPAGRGPEAH